MPRRFRSPTKLYKSPSKVKKQKSPSPKTKDYRKRAKSKSDYFSRCTFINKYTGERCKNNLGLYPEFCYIHTLKINNLAITPSQIPNAGNGLFAGEYGFKKGDIIAQYGYPWNKVSLKTLDERCKYKGNKCYEYIFCEEDTCWDGYDIRSTIARNSNSAWKTKFRHNAYFDIIKGEPYIMASRNIAPGAEIFTDYGENYF